MHDTYYADDQANSFVDDKDQCDGKDADSSRKSMHSRKLGDCVEDDGEINIWYRHRNQKRVMDWEMRKRCSEMMLRGTELRQRLG